MKLVKSLICLAIFIAAFSFQSCEKDSTVMPPPEKGNGTFETPTTTDQIPPDAQIAFMGDGFDPYSDGFEEDDFDCKFENCKVKVNNLIDHYQPFVDGSCKPMQFLIVCCNAQGELKKHVVKLYPPKGCLFPHKLTH